MGGDGDQLVQRPVLVGPALEGLVEHRPQLVGGEVRGDPVLGGPAQARPVARMPGSGVTKVNL
ncbi:MAG: hypothetical protein R3F62_21125 [Planctomycetota bacterium]